MTGEPISVKHIRSTMSSPQLPPSLNVPAEVSLTPYVILNKYLSISGDKGTLQGHESKMLKPLPCPGLVLKRWSKVYRALIKVLGTEKRARMTEEVLRCQAVYGRAFPSARFLADGAGASEKTWDRCLDMLRENDWVDTARCHRPEGKLSVNLIDLRKLWKLILKLLTATKVQRLSQTQELWLKVHGAWSRVEQIQLPMGPSS